MSIDPHQFDSDALKSALESELAGLSPEELERMAGAKGTGPAGAKGGGKGHGSHGHGHGHGSHGHGKDAERGRIHGTIVSISGDVVLIDIGGKSEAFVAAEEFDAENPAVVGAAHDFLIQGPDRDSGMMRLSLKSAMHDADISSAQIGDVIEAKVTGVNIGGLELSAKGLRAFMPKSQVELHRIEDFTPYIGHKMECEITEVNRKGGTLVVSRRKILERQREAARQEAKYSLAEGQTRKGKVVRLADFGAFVDIGGIEGLLHIGDMSYGRIKHPRDLLKEGQEVDVQILKIDHAKDRISLGMKQLAPDPWNVVEANYRVGSTYDARVVKLMDFGAFVALEEGVEGLIPISEMSWTQRLRHPRDILKEGDSIRVSVINVDPEKRKLTLSLKALSEDPWKSVGAKYTPDSVVSGLVMRLADFGAFVQLEEGVEGLVHISEMSDRHIRTPSEAAKVGDVVQVRVKSVDLEQRRVSLSMKLAAPAHAAGPHEHAAASMPAAAPPPPPKARKKPLKGGLD
ncbi:MAG: hypothetical protein AMXMBFR47_01280 [Planctomycetota bacterium]